MLSDDPVETHGRGWEAPRLDPATPSFERRAARAPRRGGPRTAAAAVARLRDDPERGHRRAARVPAPGRALGRAAGCLAVPVPGRPGTESEGIGPSLAPGQSLAPIVDPGLGIDATPTPVPRLTQPPTGTHAPTLPPVATPRPTTRPAPTPTTRPVPTPGPTPTPTPTPTPAPTADFTWSQEGITTDASTSRTRRAGSSIPGAGTSATAAAPGSRIPTTTSALPDLPGHADGHGPRWLGRRRRRP